MEFHPVGIIHRFAGLDAQQYILHPGIFLAQIVGIVGYHQGKPRFPGNTHNTLVNGSLLLNAVILQFQIEMLRSKDLSKLQCIRFCLLIILIQQKTGNRTAKAGRKTNKPITILA